MLSKGHTSSSPQALADDYRQQKILKVPGQHKNEKSEQNNPSSAHTIERPV